MADIVVLDNDDIPDEEEYVMKDCLVEYNEKDKARAEQTLADAKEYTDAKILEVETGETTTLESYVKTADANKAYAVRLTLEDVKKKAADGDGDDGDNDGDDDGEEVYDYFFKLYAADGTELSSVEMNLPLESVVVDMSYNDTTREVTLTLGNGKTVEIPVGEIFDGLVNVDDFNTAIEEIKESITDAIEGLDVEDEKRDGYYVSNVGVSGGKLIIGREPLPTASSLSAVVDVTEDETDEGNVYGSFTKSGTTLTLKKNITALTEETVANSIVEGDTDAKYATEAKKTTGTLTISQNATAKGKFNGSEDVSIELTDTTYDNASTSAAGLMSKDDYSKLADIEAGANNYTLPVAGEDLGGIKTGYTSTDNNRAVQLVTGTEDDTIHEAFVNIPDASADNAGLMSKDDYSKLADIEYMEDGAAVALCEQIFGGN